MDVWPGAGALVVTAALGGKPALRQIAAAVLLWTHGAPLEGRSFLLLILQLIPTAILFTWVFNHTRASILVAILLHAAINWSQGLTSDLFPAVAFNEVGPVVALGLTALVIVVATRGRLGYARAGDGAAPGPADDPAGAGRAVEVPGGA